MFTPPPSPNPFDPKAFARQQEQTRPHLSAETGQSVSLLMPPSPAPSRPRLPAFSQPAPPPLPIHTAKKAAGRRLRLLALLVPVLLVLITLASRRAFLSSQFLTPLSPPSVPLPFHAAAHDPGINAGLARHQHHRRNNVGGSSTSTVASSSSSTIDASQPSSGSLPASSSTSPLPLSSQTAPPIPSSNPPPALPTPFPQPFDASLGANFTSVACQAFFANFTVDINFRSCRAFSLLLTNSAAFFQQETDLASLNDIVWGTCNTDPSVDTCQSTMEDLSSRIKDACAPDLKQGNALAHAALVGFDNFALYRAAGCLADGATGAYCYLEALASDSPDDLYFWTVGLGAALPPGAHPSCATCTLALMRAYAVAAKQGTEPIAQAYAAASNASNAKCGVGWAPPVDLHAGAMAGVARGPWWAALGLGLAMAVCLVR